MKKSFIIFTFAIAAAVATSQAVTFPLTLLNFGSNTYVLDGANTSPTPGQTTTNLSYTGATLVLGSQFVNSSLTLTTLDWTPYQNSLKLFMSVTSISESTPFSLTLYDTGGGNSNYQGTAASTAGILTELPLTLDLGGTVNFADIAGVQLTWGGGATGVTSTIQEVRAVPEPSTYALLGMGAVALSGYVVRRRRRA